MKKLPLIALTSITLLALSACSSSNTDSSDLLPVDRTSTSASSSSTSPSSSASPIQSPSPTASVKHPTVTEASSSSSATSTDDKCSNMTQEEAVTEWINEVPEYFPSDTDSPYNNNPGSSWISEEDPETYDPCADLSWVLLRTNGNSVAIPYQVMLFHKGEYIGTPAKTSFAFHPDVTRDSDDTISIGYRWIEGSESNAEAKVRAVSTFTYNPETNGVTHSGTWPHANEYYSIRADGTLPIDDVRDAGASNKAGGDIPADATELSSNSSAFTTPSENIACDLDSEDPRCVVISDEETYEMGDSLSRSKPRLINNLSSAGSLASNSSSLKTVEYSETVYSGMNACTVEESGVTCWNVNTGHGVFLTRGNSVIF